ncbi:MAG: hypothetical protein H0T75_20705 [Rhizobiales bacterium]|nr:hypothetical protein [Hyphomicrobiales bacterium]
MLSVLERVLPDSSLVLESASGTGQLWFDSLRHSPSRLGAKRPQLRGPLIN